MNTSGQIEIEWPCVALFNYLCDITNNAEWQNEVIHAEWICRTPVQLGSSFSEIRRAAGEVQEVTFTVAECIPHRKRTVVTDDGQGFTLEFIPLSAQCTRLEVTLHQSDNEAVFFTLANLIKLKNKLEEVYC